MSQAFEGNVRTPITLIEAGPCVVTQIKTETKDGLQAVQLGFGSKKLKNTSKAQEGHTKKAATKTQPRFFAEAEFIEGEELKIGDTIKASDILSVGDTIEVTGVSKGKGFQGGVKRWGFAGGPKTHGQSDRHRAPGSIGQGTTPGRVYKGKRMAGRMGTDQITVKNLHVVSISPETNQVAVSGPVPGTPGHLLKIKRLSEGKKVEKTETQEILETPNE